MDLQSEPIEHVRHADDVAAMPMRPYDAVVHSLASLPQEPPSTQWHRQTDVQLEVRQGFLVGGLGLMIRFRDATALADLPQVARLPGAPHWFEGMANLQGRLVPVFDLARFAGLPGGRPRAARLLLLSQGADAAGIVIEGLPQRLRFAVGALKQPAGVPQALADCIDQACVIEARQWFDLQVGRLLDALASPGARH
jgi:chemotaxis signal transduction protein